MVLSIYVCEIARKKNRCWSNLIHTIRDTLWPGQQSLGPLGGHASLESWHSTRGVSEFGDSMGLPRLVLVLPFVSFVFLGKKRMEKAESICAKLFVAMVHEDLMCQAVDRLPDVNYDWYHTSLQNWLCFMMTDMALKTSSGPCNSYLARWNSTIHSLIFSQGISTTPTSVGVWSLGFLPTSLVAASINATTDTLAGCPKFRTWLWVKTLYPWWTSKWL